MMLFDSTFDSALAEIRKVLILLMLDDALRQLDLFPMKNPKYVLILLMLDDALRQDHHHPSSQEAASLNPSYAG